MTPRIRRLRYRHFSRVRHSEVFGTWLKLQATRLSMSEEDIFNMLVDGSSSEDVENKPTPKPDPTPTPTPTTTTTTTPETPTGS